ncbi:MAG TPA: ABC transporter ATP-binding protein [Candidatus Latescibacteria bacterium]|nr:ABC transporter ATP-binding protein [Candidatus Latescibacterota bacterium]
MNMEQPLLELRDVTKVFKIGGGLGLVGRRLIRAVDRVSFAIPGESPIITALVGESGSGKSTIARLILGLLEPTSGVILYKGRDVRSWLKSDRVMYRREVQVIFQDPYSTYNPFYRVERVLHMVIKKFGLASSEREGRDLIMESMRTIGLRPEDLLGRYPHQLSGGERQRLMLARILLIKPKLVVADEPVSMIDVSLRSIFLENLLDLKGRLKMSCLYITHDLNIAHYVADRMIVLCLGNIVEMGEAKSVVGEALHPYTRLLVRSIPIPDPRRRWKGRLQVEDITFRGFQAEQGCVFSNRCPHAMPVCKEETPPLIEARPGHKAACFLYR